MYKKFDVKDLIDTLNEKLSYIQDEASKLLGIKETIENTANTLETKGNEMINYGNKWTRTEVQDVCAVWRTDPSAVPGGQFACELLGAGQKAKEWGNYLKSSAQTLRSAAKDIETIANNVVGAAGAAGDYVAGKSQDIYAAVGVVKDGADAVMNGAESAGGKVEAIGKSLSEGRESAENTGGYVENLQSDLEAIGEEAGKAQGYVEKIDLGAAKVGDRIEAAKAIAKMGGRAAASYLAWLTIASYGGLLALPALAAWYAYRTVKAAERAGILGSTIPPEEALALGEVMVE